MKDPSDDIRDWLFTSLNNNITYGSIVPVYSFPPKDAAKPYIVIGEQSSPGEDSPKDRYMSEHDVTLEIWTSHTGNNASYVAANSISSSILQLIRTRAQTNGYARDEGGVAMANFNVIRVNMRGMVTDVFLNDQEIIVYKSLNINLLLEES